MTRQTDSWDQDRQTPRHASYHPQEENSQAFSLPPPSSFTNGVHHSQSGPNRVNDAYRSHHSAAEAYSSAPSIPALRHAQGPIAGPEAYFTSSANNRRPVDPGARHSPSHSSTASDYSEDLPDYMRARRLPNHRSPRPAFPPPSHFPAAHEHPALRAFPPEPQLARAVPNGLGQPGYRDGSSQASSSSHQAWSQPGGRAPERMKIADLLSSEQSSTPDPTIPEPSSKAAQKAPQRSFAPAATPVTYRIHIRQQPVAARSCGYGERDRRVIDPPPIVQMEIIDPTSSDEDIKRRLDRCYSVMHCTIWNEAGDTDMSSMPEDYRTQRRLTGTVVSSPFVGKDINDEYGCFFCFPDLSCRTPGSFRLQFSFMVLNRDSAPGGRVPVVDVVMSDVFTVYNAKDFPGMKASTALTKKLKEQGCLISIKKGNDRIRGRVESPSESEDDEVSTSANGARHSKRAKKP
ncbi:hypothetical protein GGS20DRAFT_277924 [Poronia punctata]|nr:hypothetical protein GGS20DRAFT_277924 [Poronia punctata]